MVTNVKSLDITLKYDVDYTKPERAKLFRGGVDTFFAAKFVKYNKSIYGADNDLLPNEWCTIEEAINKIQNSTFNEYTETRLAVLNKIKSNLSSVEKPHFNKW